MPCHDYTSDNWVDPKSTYEYLRLKEHADMLARVACKSLTLLEEEGLIGHLTDNDDEVANWWDYHKEQDAMAQARKNEAKRRAEAKASAMSKLSTEELEALGIKRPAKKKGRK